MTRKELPQLIPDQDLGADGMRRFDLFWRTLQANPAMMHEIVGMHPTYELLAARAAEIDKTELTTDAALAVTSLAALLRHQDDTLIDPANTIAHSAMQHGLQAAIKAHEEGKPTPTQRRVARIGGVIKAYAEAAPPEQPLKEEDILKQLGIKVAKTEQSTVAEIPAPRAPEPIHGASLAA